MRDSTGTVNLWEGSIRSGKTYASILAFLIALAALVSAHAIVGEVVIVGKNRDSIFRNFFEPIEKAPGLKWFTPFVQYRNGAPTATIFGVRVHVIGANDAKAESKIRGMTIQLGYIDELTVIPVDFFMQFTGRMSVDGAQLFATTNPDSPAHWLKVQYLDVLEKLPHWRRFHFTMDDNPSLSQDFIDQRKAEYTGLWYKRFILGLWVAAEGAIFNMWDPDHHVVPWEDLPRIQRYLGVAVDYGTAHASSAILLGLTAEKRRGRLQHRLALVDEWRYDPSGAGPDGMTDNLAPSQQAVELKKWLKRPHLPYENSLQVPRRVFVDPAAKHFARELNLNRAGRHEADDALGTDRAENDHYGISRMASLLAERQLIVSSSCAGFIREVPSYSWDPRAIASGREDPVKIADDSLDAGRYALMSTEKRWARTIDNEWLLPAA